jgi:diguanylate cyclase (GGDEF)-like protein
LADSPLHSYGDFLLSLGNAIQAHRSDGESLAVVMIGLEGLAQIDEARGYEAGDQILALAAERIRSVLRSADFAGRIGRDQLACALIRLPGDDLASLAAEKLLRLLDESFELAGRPLHLMPHVGVGFLAPDVEGASDLLRRANIAMQESRRRKLKYRAFDSADQARLALQFDLQIDLEEAIDKNELGLCYRLQMDLDEDRITGAEALLRWDHAKKGPIAPMEIISAAERAGLTSRLTDWMISTALRECAQMRRQGLVIGMSINVSAVVFRDAGLDDMLSRALALWDVPPASVVIELGESIGVEPALQAVEVLNRLRTMGLQLSDGGFGMSHSSMMRLRELPFSEMKISRSFVTDMLLGEENELIVRAMIDLGLSLDLRVVADGVDDAETCDALRFLGCNSIQGDFVSPLVSMEKLISGEMRKRHDFQSGPE